MKYFFNEFQLDTTQFTLLRKNGNEWQPVTIEPKVFDLVVYLIEHRDRLVTRQELFEQVWDGRQVVDASLSNHIKTARKVLGDRSDLQSTIKTVRGRGYQFVALIQGSTDHRLDNHELTLSAERVQLAQPVTNSATESWSRHWRPLHVITLVLVTALVIGSLYLSQSKKTNPVLLVTPFTGSDDGAKDWQPFAEQLTREVILKLRHISDVQVIPASSSFTFKENHSTNVIHHRLPNVTHVVRARVNANGTDRVQITAELESVPDGDLLWDNKFVTVITDNNFFSVQSTIASSVTDTLKVYLTRADKKALQQLPTTNLKAYETFIQGQQQLNRLTHSSVLEAVSLFDQAIQLDRSFTRAYIARVDALRVVMTYFENPSETLPKVITAVDHALGQDPDAAEAMSSLGLAYVFAWRWNDAWQMLNAARHADDSLALTELGFALYYAGVGEPEKVKSALERAKQLDPLNVEIADWGHWALAMVGDTTSALAWSDTMLQLHPDVGLLHSGASVSHSITGNHETAIALAEKGVTLDSGSPYSLIALAQAYAHAGNESRARALLNDAESSDKYQCPYETAVAYILLDNVDRAFELFNEAVAYRSNCLVFTRYDARLSRIRHDSRYQVLLTRIGLDDAALAKLPK
jgi:DNA-binding winged helix-turn-helix (wHTH) protein/TolB-like protein/tetratricopeptide (TPR) repeat protein